jgi:hypothetical protein
MRWQRNIHIITACLHLKLFSWQESLKLKHSIRLKLTIINIIGNFFKTNVVQLGNNGQLQPNTQFWPNRMFVILLTAQWHTTTVLEQSLIIFHTTHKSYISTGRHPRYINLTILIHNTVMQDTMQIQAAWHFSEVTWFPQDLNLPQHCYKCLTPCKLRPLNSGNWDL